jgi:hypothetical protein
LGGGDGVGGEDVVEGGACFCHGGLESVQETRLGQAETIDSSLPKPGFTENSDHSLAVKTRLDND